MLFPTKVVIIADDDEDDIELFDTTLRLNCEQCLVHGAANGPSLFLLLETVTKPDLIVLDINMPGMSGFECLQKLKAEEYTKDIPVLMMSTAPAEQAAKTAIKQGASAYITKSSDLTAFRREVFKIYEDHLI